MNILIVSATYPPSINGVAISTKRSVEALRKLGHRAYVIVPNSDKNLEENHTRYTYFLPSLPNPYIENYKLPIPIFTTKLRKWLKNKKIDIVHVHHPFGVSVLAKRITKHKKCPLVFTHHTRYGECNRFYTGPVGKHLINMGVEHFCNNSCDAIIATTQTFQKELSKLFKPPVHYASTAGLMKTMKSRKKKDTLRKKLNLSQNKTLLLNVSRHAVEKNLDLLIKIMLRLDKDKYHLVMAGDGPHKSDLEKLAREKKLDDCITFTGFVKQDNLNEYYSSVDMFLYSSQTDTIGINILEAMSAGLPVLAADDPSTAEAVEHGVNGYLLESNARAFTKHIRLVAEEEELRQQLAANALRTAKKFMVKETTKELVKVYDEVIGG